MMKKRNSRILMGFLALIAVCLCARLGLSQEPAASPAPAKLRIITTQTEPFVITRDGEPLSGYSIDLWNQIAKEAGLTCEITTVDSVTKVLKALQEGKADVGVGCITITAARDKIVDFSYPFLRTGSQILVKSVEDSDFWSSCVHFLKADVLKVLGFLLVVVFIFGNVVWLTQRKVNPENFPPSYFHGVVEGMWWSLSIIIIGEQHDVEVAGWTGRVVRMIWALVGVAVFTYVTATITTTMTVSTLASEIKGLADLRAHITGTVAGSATQTFLSEEGIHARGYHTIDDAIDALSRGEVDAVVYDAPVLEYHLTKRKHTDLKLISDIYGIQDYGFALQKGSPFRGIVDLALLGLNESGYLSKLDKKWFAKEDME